MPTLNISIDDVSPHHMSGLDVIEQCELIRSVHPDVKFTLFVPVAYWRTIHIPGRADTRTVQPLKLTVHPDFCRRLQELPDDVYEVGFHGYYHGIYGQSNNDEFRHVNFDQAMNLTSMMLAEVDNAGLAKRFRPVFRPPAMWMSYDALDAVSQRFKVLALSDRKIYVDHARGGRTQAQRNGALIIDANVWPPDAPIPDEIREDTCILLHACNWDKGYLDASMRDKLTACISNSENVNFVHMMDSVTNG